MNIKGAAVLGAIVIALTAVSISLGRWSDEQRAVARTELKVAQSGAKAALLLADNAIAVAKRAADSAAIYRAQRDSLNRRSHSLETSVAELKGRFHEASLVAPDTCKPVILLAGLTIDSLTQLSQTQTARAQADSGRIVTLSVALDSTQTALNSARLSLGQLGKAADAVEHAARRSILSAILPHPGYGATAGIDAFGKPNAVVGFTLSWSF